MSSAVLRCEFDAKHRLGIVTPVSECDLIPGIGLTDDFSADAAKDVESKYTIEYNWSQSPLRGVCLFHQNRRSIYNCALTNINYCSRACFFVGFQQVRRQLCTNQVCPVSLVDNLNVYGVSTSRRVVHSIRGDRASLWDYYRCLKDYGFMFSKKQKEHVWLPLTTDKGVFPENKDVGKQYKLALYACDKQGQQIDVEFGRGTNAVNKNEIVTEVCLPSGPVTSLNGSIFPCENITLSENEGFTILSWNVLSDIYTTEDFFSHAQPAYLSWEYRRHRIMAQIDALNPDIICLQEVQSDHFKTVFESTLRNSGYAGFYKSKKNKGYVKGAYIVDGCATFYKVEKFKVVNLISVEYANLITNLHTDVTQMNSNAASNRLMRDNVLMTITLEVCDQSLGDGFAHYSCMRDEMTERILDFPAGQYPLNRQTVYADLISVTNTHILANPEIADVKFWQTAVLLQHLSAYSKHVRQQILPNIRHASIIAGDFNSTPGSAVYNYVIQGVPDVNHPDMRWDKSGLLGMATSQDRFSHNLKLRSMNAEAMCRERGIDPSLYNKDSEFLMPFRSTIGICEPIWTNCTPKFSGCLDYIFFEYDKLVLVSVMKMPMENVIAAEGERNSNLTCHFPMPHRPSDHLQLFGRFTFRK